ncbi:MAG: hypothetical protein ACKO66_11415, partial [Flavobacteriales bacterium]
MRTIIPLFIAGSCFGQSYVDVLRVTQASTPCIPIDSGYGKTALLETAVDLNIPVPLGDKRYFVTGAAYDQFQATFKDSIHICGRSALLKAGLQWSDSWNTWMVMMIPRFSSDGQIQSRDDYQLGGMITFKRRKHERFNWQAGLYANTERSGPFVVPMLGWWWKSANEHWESSALLPLNADVHRRFPTGTRVGLAFVSMVRSYQLHGSYFGSKDPYAVKANNEIFGYIQTKPIKGFILQLRLGRSIGRSIKLYEHDARYDLGVSAFKFGDERVWLNPLFRDSGVAQLRLIYRLDV